jgi:hypothetical protein
LESELELELASEKALVSESALASEKALVSESALASEKALVLVRLHSQAGYPRFLSL